MVNLEKHELFVVILVGYSCIFLTAAALGFRYLILPRLSQPPDHRDRQRAEVERLTRERDEARAEVERLRTALEGGR